jgi:hypothetical protein
MNIKTKYWTAQIDRMPGANSFRAYGTVTVAHTGITPRLELSAIQDKPYDLSLDLKFETSNQPALQVVTDKFVEYKVQGDSYVTGVSIFHEGTLIHHIDEVLITH